MVEWIASQPDVQGKALVIGCGLGDDAEWLSAIGFEVTAFDISESSIQWCKERFPSTDVDYIVADLLNPPPKWLNQYDLVVEIHILQAIPEEVRDPAASQIPGLLNSKDRCCVSVDWLDFKSQTNRPHLAVVKNVVRGTIFIAQPNIIPTFHYEESPSIDRYLASWIAD